MAVRYTCDICGKECGDTQYLFPVMKSLLSYDGATSYYDSEKYNLCVKCSVEIYKAIKPIISRKDK